MAMPSEADLDTCLEPAIHSAAPITHRQTEMRPLTKEALSRFESAFNPEEDVLTLVADTIGGTVTANGLWRIFGRSAPPPGVVQWNEPTLWKTCWGEVARDKTCIGEDIFGNQLVCIPETADLLIWDHESGSLFTLEAPPDVALAAVLEHGIDWIEFYKNGSPRIALHRLPDVPDTSHLHWTMPLVLGGAVDVNNTSIVERTKHLIGHAMLWQQVRDLPPGTKVIIKQN